VLEMLHAQNCYHRDVSPDNILILQGGGPMLLDFGSARHIVGGMTESLTVVLNPGFAPVEQYADADDPNFQQGPWTDIYGVGAVLYFLLTGKPPIASVARLVKDPIIKLADSTEFPGVPRSFREAIDRALAVAPDQRIQSVAQLRQALRLPTYKSEGHFGNLSGATSSAVAQQESEATVLLERGSSAGAPFPPTLQPAKRSTSAYGAVGDADDAPTLQLAKRSISAWDALIESGLQANAGAILHSGRTPQPGEQGGAWDTSDEDDEVLAPFGRVKGSVDAILPPASQSGEEHGGSVSNTPIEVAQAIPEEDPPPDQDDDDADEVDDADDADDDSEARAVDDAYALPVFTGVPASSSPNSGQSAQAVAAQVLQQSAAAALGATQAIGRQPPWFRNIALGVIGLVVVVAVAVGLLHKNQRAAAGGKDRGLAANQTGAPATKEVKLPLLPVKPSANNPASGATAVGAGPQVVADPASAVQVTVLPDHLSAAKSSFGQPQQPSVPKVDASPVADRSPSVTSAPDNAPFVRLFIKPWGQIVVDGRPGGISPPLTRLPLSPGPHVITITNGDLPPVTLRVTVPEEGNIIVAHEFE